MTDLLVELPVEETSVDTASLRKARGAFFTPDKLSRFIANWAIRSADDRVLEPSAGDAAFLVQAVRRLRELDPERQPEVHGVEIHEHSARIADQRVADAGGLSRLTVSDFFEVEPNAEFSAVIGNPPYIRYQDFAGASRLRAREAALREGVALSGLASSWAAFVVHAASFLRPGGRIGFVLPAELLSVNYAAPVRQFLFDRFSTIDLVLFEEQVFPEAEADVVLLLADGYREGSTDHARIMQAQNAEGLAELGLPLHWSPRNPADKWTASLLGPSALSVYSSAWADGAFGGLNAWGVTKLGMVTGNNRYFALSGPKVRELGLASTDVMRLSPPGSSHLRTLAYSRATWSRHASQGELAWLFRPAGEPSDAAWAYIAAGETAGVDQAYKCRVRSPWWRVPLQPKADLSLTYMNADTPRLSTNAAEVHHLNSVHGVHLAEPTRAIGRRYLPLASLSSMTLLGAEMVGRAYGGGMLKIEPREADGLPVPTPELVMQVATDLDQVRGRVAAHLSAGSLAEASALVDEVILVGGMGMARSDVAELQEARKFFAARRTTRASTGRLAPLAT
ncbi:MAG: HsdM family class I SAM-dependent methyltransferase [Solirubrobacterales bacterium]